MHRSPMDEVETFVTFLSNSIDLSDIADILIVSVCLYPVLRWLQTTSSRGPAVGAAFGVLIYAVATQFDLHLTAVLLQFVFTIAAVVAVVVFQEDIRRAVAMTRITRRWWGRGQTSARQTEIDTIVTSAYNLAGRGQGALIVLPGAEPLALHIDGGVELQGRLSSALLDSLFDPHSDGHDGAVIIRDGVVTHFAAHLPLSEDLRKSAQLGTRHRSGLGLSERADVLVIIVSEERRQVSIALHGDLQRNVARSQLTESIQAHLAAFTTDTARSRNARFWSFLFRHPRSKLLAVLIAFMGWLMIASDRDMVQRVFVLPIVYRNVPQDFHLPESIPTEARVTFSASERAFQFVAPSVLKVSVDLKEASTGKDVFTLTESNVRHPSSLTVYRIEPRTIQLQNR
ncbi:MAG TPA: diadenylate cyclase [Planctomycetaceae bacterium]|nr:diadenylate cyclase [Planctomycetaceae bacterium]